MRETGRETNEQAEQKLAPTVRLAEAHSGHTEAKLKALKQ